VSKSERLNKIQKMLAHGAVAKTQCFMDELEVSRATFKRYIEYLRDRLGAPIVWDAGAGDSGGYRLDLKPGGEGKHQMPGL
jgi:predicted DNA-binding transcriptional regulator YafY